MLNDVVAWKNIKMIERNNMNIKWTYSIEMVNYINQNNLPVLVVVGPTGSGKTTISSYLEREYNSICVIRNFTTRQPRTSDNYWHFDYLKEEEYYKIINTNNFFIGRLGKKPFYGYKNSDLKSVFVQNKVPLFMFRDSGLDVIVRLIKRVYVLIIECDPIDALTHSNDEYCDFTIDSIIDTYTQINDIIERNPLCICRIQNKYDKEFFFDTKLHQFIRKILNVK